MADFITPYTTDVSQFGADNNNVGRYKQAAEYADDAQKAAEMAQAAIQQTDDLLKVAQELLERADASEADIIKLQNDYQALAADLQTKMAQIDSKITDINSKLTEVDTKLGQINGIINTLLNMSVTVNSVAHGTPASGSFNNTTGVFTFNIPDGAPGADGSVTGLNTVPTGTPAKTDLGFYVEQPSNTVKKATMVDIAKVFPSVQNISYNGDDAKETGEINITKAKLGLASVRDVEGYSKVETTDKYKNSYKVYATKAEALADAPNREQGEKVVVWEGDSKLGLPTAPYTTHDIYTVDKSSGTAALTLVESLNRIETVNGQAPDDKGNINVTIPTGNPSLYLGEMLMFPYNPEDPYVGSGLIPADGRLLSRTDLAYKLLWEEVKAGRLPAVPESEWQAGKKAYYSYGGTQGGGAGGDADETDGSGPQFRVPDWTDGTALRTPNVATEGSGADEYDGSFYDQIPYIETINTTLVPDDDGNLQITATDIGALATDGVAASATKLETPRKIAGVDFDGTADVDITASNVGALADNIKAKDIEGADVDAAGLNTNIKKLSGLTGTLKLGVSGTAGLDAVSFAGMASYVATHGGGTGSGATLNGVMTTFIGSVEWFNGIRSEPGKVPMPGYIAADGQLLKRSDYPDLWAAISGGILASSSTDAAWVASAAERGKYTKGTIDTGADANFRVPDLNGVLVNGTGGFTGPSSFKEPFLRGSATRTPGSVQDSAVKNHTHLIHSAYNGNTATAATTDNTRLEYGITENSTPAPDFRSQPVESGGDTESRPINVSGVWVIRANGGFESAKNNFNVINNLTTAPATGDVNSGGKIVSNLQISGAPKVVASLSAESTKGATAAADTNQARLTIGTDATTPATPGFLFTSIANGKTDTLETDGTFNLYGGGGNFLRLREDGTVRLQDGSNNHSIEMNNAGLAFDGNIVTAHVVGSGFSSNAPGPRGWIRYSDGTQICWGRLDTTYITNTAWGALYNNGSTPVPKMAFPQPFVAIPVVTVGGMFEGGSGSGSWVIPTTVDTTGVNCTVVSAVNNGRCRPSYHAIGRWK